MPASTPRSPRLVGESRASLLGLGYFAALSAFGSTAFAGAGVAFFAAGAAAGSAGAFFAVPAVGAFAAVSPSASARMVFRQAARPAFVLGCSQLLWSKCWRVISSPWFVVSCWQVDTLGVRDSVRRGETAFRGEPSAVRNFGARTSS